MCLQFFFCIQPKRISFVYHTKDKIVNTIGFNAPINGHVYIRQHWGIYSLYLYINLGIYIYIPIPRFIYISGYICMYPDLYINTINIYPNTVNKGVCRSLTRKYPYIFIGVFIYKSGYMYAPWFICKYNGYIPQCC